MGTVQYQKRLSAEYLHSALELGFLYALGYFILGNFQGIVYKAYAAYDAHSVQYLMCAAHCDFIGLSFELKL